MIVDFHSHTCESDGTLTPQALADFMGERNVEVFSISDHDTMTAYGKFTPPPGARVVTGVEINTTYRGNEVHLLGLRHAGGFARTARDDRTQSRRAARARRNAWSINCSAPDTVSPTTRCCARHPTQRQSGRPHVAKALIAQGSRARYRLGVPQSVAHRNAGICSVAAHHAARGDRTDLRGRRCRRFWHIPGGSKIAR